MPTGVGVGGAAGYAMGLINSAQGRITIDTSQAEQAPGKMQGVAQGINNAMNSVAGTTAKAQDGINQFARALGVGFGAAGIVQLGKMAIDANAIATAFNRQSVAARNLAGGQEKLNELLAAYSRATSGAIDKAQTMADVTRLQAVGMADNAQELERFVSAARGASVAMGRSTQDILGEVQLAVANQSFRRLDQIGLGVDEVHQRMDELKASTAGMTDEAAFQEAVIQKLTEKYGGLAKSVEALPTGIEHAKTALKDFRLEFGEMAKGITDFSGDAFANWLEQTGKDLKTATDFIGPFIHQFQELQWMLSGKSIAFQNGLSIRQPTLLPSAANFNQTTGSSVNPNQKDIDATKLDWAKGISELNQKTNEDLLQQNSDYQRQRADSERQYQESTLRAAEDFGLQRQREEQDMADSISRIHRDSAERESRQAEDLARSISTAQTDSAERVAKTKIDANQRLNDLDENYQRDREKAARHFHDSIIEAAGRLDAKAVAEAQRNFEEQQQDAKDAHDDQRDKLQKQLSERLDDEAKSLDKSIKQQQDAYNRQLQDGRDADAQRITDMQTDFAKRKTQEDVDYGIRLERAQQDNQDQLTEMDRAEGERIQQIIDHARKDRTQLDTEHKAAMIALGVHNKAWIDEQTAKEKALEGLWDKYFNHVADSITPGQRGGLGPSMIPGGAGIPNLGGAYTVPSAYSGGGGTVRNSSVGNISFQIYAGPNATPSDIADAVDARLAKHLKDWAA